MKGKLITLLILVCLLLSLITFLSNPINLLESKQQKVVEETKETYKTLTYIITDISGNDYYGESLDGKTKITFNRENIKVPIEDPLKVNDKILAYVESENLVEGLVKVEKLQ